MEAAVTSRKTPAVEEEVKVLTRFVQFRSEIVSYHSSTNGVQRRMLHRIIHVGEVCATGLNPMNAAPVPCRI